MNNNLTLVIIEYNNETVHIIESIPEDLDIESYIYNNLGYSNYDDIAWIAASNISTRKYKEPYVKPEMYER